MKERVPFIGAPRDASCRRTVRVITGKLRRLGRFPAGGRLLDVGCGDGVFTVILGESFQEIYGIDVQEPFLNRFRENVRDDPRFKVLSVSAAKMPFADDFFDTVVSIETLEHIGDLPGAAAEICRVLRGGGDVDYRPKPVVSI